MSSSSSNVPKTTSVTSATPTTSTPTTQRKSSFVGGAILIIIIFAIAYAIWYYLLRNSNKKLANGSKCTISSDCQSNFCNGNNICSDSGNNGENGGSGGNQGATCQDQSQCESPLICVQDTCQNQGGMNVPAGQFCKTQNDCIPGLTCMNNKCVTTSSTLASSFQLQFIGTSFNIGPSTVPYILAVTSAENIGLSSWIPFSKIQKPCAGTDPTVPNVTFSWNASTKTLFVYILTVDSSIKPLPVAISKEGFLVVSETPSPIEFVNLSGGLTIMVDSYGNSLLVRTPLSSPNSSYPTGFNDTKHYPDSGLQPNQPIEDVIFVPNSDRDEDAESNCSSTDSIPFVPP